MQDADSTQDTTAVADWKFFFDVVSSDIYKKNAYRQLRLPINASNKTIKKKAKELEWGESIEDLSNPENAVYLPYCKGVEDEASKRLSNPELRFIDGFFWFWPEDFENGSDADDALLALQEERADDAASMWGERVRLDADGNAVHNLAILHHMRALDAELGGGERTLKTYHWNEACQWWRSCLSHEQFWAAFQDRTRKSKDLQLTSGKARQLRKTLPVALASINSTLALKAAARGDNDEVQFQLKLIEAYRFEQATVDRAKLLSAAPLRENINVLCEGAEREGAQNPQQAHVACQNMLLSITEQLGAFDQVLPSGLFHDEVHDTIAQCLQKNGTLLLKSDDFEGVELLESARKFAGSETERIRIEEDLFNYSSAIGRKLSSSDRETEAIPFLKKAVHLKEEGVNYHWLGSTLANLNRHAEALPYLTKAVELRGEQADQKWLGRTLLKLNRKKEALPYLKRAVELGGDEVDTTVLISTLFELDKSEEAIPYITQVVDSDSDPASLSSLARMLFESGKFSEALPYFKKAVELRGENIDYHLYGVTLLKLNRKQEALPYLKRAVELGGDETDYFTLVGALLELDKPKEAIPYLKRLVEISDNVDVYLTLAVALMKSNKKKEAVPYLEKAVELRGNENDYSGLINLLFELGRKEDGMRWLQKGVLAGAIHVDPELANAAASLKLEEKPRKRSWLPWRR